MTFGVNSKIPTAEARDVRGPAVWASAASLIGARLRRGAPLIGICALAGALLAPLALTLLPASYQSTAQIVIDPRGLQVFAGEQGGAVVDANAGINFVETQLQLLTSERVLARVARAEGAAGREPGQKPDADAPVDPRAIAALRRSLTVKRGERSFVVDVTAKASTPARAAMVANAVVQAFIEEDAASRADAGRRLNAEIAGRLTTLRDQLAKSEAAVETFRSERGLLSSGGDRLVSEQRLEQAVSDLGAAQVRVARSAARVAQLDAAKFDIGSLGPLTATEDMRTISYLIERLSTAREALADARVNLGPRHPGFASAQHRVSEIESRIGAEVARIREAERASLERARGEQTALEGNVATLAATVAKDRKSGSELRTMEEQVKADRDLLGTFETRSREADEFSRVSPANLRIASVATADEAAPRLALTVVAVVIGAILGAMLAIGLLALSAAFAIARRPSAGDTRPTADVVQRKPDPVGGRPPGVVRAG